jgi:tetratricopeptide (TPR) repeat protein
MRNIKLIILILITTPVFGQGNNGHETKFKASYELEAAAKYDQAIAALEQVYDENSYEINLRLGWLNYLGGDYPASQQYYSKAINLLPYAIEAKLGYVLPVSALGNWNEVVKVYESILVIDPQNTLTNYRLGLIYYERGEFEKAFSYVEKVVNLYPFDYDSVVLFAWINLKMSDFRKAKVLFSKSLLIVPGNESAMAGLKLIQ